MSRAAVPANRRKLTSASDAGPAPAKSRETSRMVLAATLAVALAAYLLAGITGRIPAGQKVGVADLSLVVIVLGIIVLLLRPSILDRISTFEFGSLKVQLRGLQKDLDEIRFVLTMLVTDAERKHLDNLEKGATSNYQLKGELLSECRRLRAIGLIRSKLPLGDMPRGTRFELSNWVELTDRGREYLARLREDRPIP